MTRREVAQLLAFAAAFDQRTVGESDVHAWYEIAQLGRWELGYARRAVVEHYADRTERLMPAHITTRLRALREEFSSTWRHEQHPAGMAEADTVRWETDRRRAHVTARMDAWASGEAAA